jgi:hypothetical protein
MGERVARIAGALVVVFLLAWLDWLAAERLTHGQLKLPMPVENVESICPAEGRARQRVVDALSEHAGIESDAACRVDLHTSSEWMLKASPYPPFLGEYDSEYPPPEAGSAVVATAGRRLQITVYWGAADTTPSRFVASVRGEESYWNDHYPTYLFVHEAADSERPKLLFAAWASREVAGMEGTRELAIAVSLLAAEVALAGLLFAVYRWRRQGSGSRGSAS